MSLYGIGTNDYSYLFQQKERNSNLITSMFGNSNSMYGDYSMIKSGAYKKLLTAYYKTQKDSSDSSSADKTTNQKETEISAKNVTKYATVKSDASDLKTAAEALVKSSLYKEKNDTEGNVTYNRDGIKDAMEKYVKAYNSFVDSSSEVDSTGVLNKALSVVKSTAANQSALKEVGITIGKDNKLSLDTEKLAGADVSKIKNLFAGYTSYGGNVSDKTGMAYTAANTAALGKSASYSRSGSYSGLGNMDSILNQILQDCSE